MIPPDVGFPNMVPPDMIPDIVTRYDTRYSYQIWLADILDARKIFDARRALAQRASSICVYVQRF